MPGSWFAYLIHPVGVLALVSGVALMIRICHSCPGLAPPGLACFRHFLRSDEGGFEDVHQVFGGR